METVTSQGAGCNDPIPVTCSPPWAAGTGDVLLLAELL
jgi:hypothetical protein